MTTIEAGCKVL